MLFGKVRLCSIGSITGQGTGLSLRLQHEVDLKGRPAGLRQDPTYRRRKILRVGHVRLAASRRNVDQGIALQEDIFRHVTGTVTDSNHAPEPPSPVGNLQILGGDRVTDPTTHPSADCFLLRLLNISHQPVPLLVTVSYWYQSRQSIPPLPRFCLILPKIDKNTRRPFQTPRVSSQSLSAAVYFVYW